MVEHALRPQRLQLVRGVEEELDLLRRVLPHADETATGEVVSLEQRDGGGVGQASDRSARQPRRRSTCSLPRRTVTFSASRCSRSACAYLRDVPSSSRTLAIVTWPSGSQIATTSAVSCSSGSGAK